MATSKNAMKKPVWLKYTEDEVREIILKIIEKIPCSSLDITEIADDKLPSKSGFLAAEIIKRVLAKSISSITGKEKVSTLEKQKEPLLRT